MRRRTRIDWSTMPVGLVTTKWLATRLGVSHGLVAIIMRRAGRTKLPVRDAILFGTCPSSFSTWVSAWGLDRVLAWLDTYAPHDAAYVRDNIDRLHDRERDIAEAEARHLDALRRKEETARQRRQERRIALKLARDRNRAKARRAPSGSPKAQARRAALLEPQPVGLVPDAVLIELGIATRYTLETYRGDNQIAPCPCRRGRWRPLIDAWGVDRARAWVSTYQPTAMGAFEADARPVPPAVVRAPAVDPKKVEAFAAKVRRDRGRQGEGRKPFLPPRDLHAPINKEEERRHIAAKLAEYLAKGGAIKRGASTGPVDVPCRVHVRELGVDA